jgi:hypothetical protein
MLRLAERSGKPPPGQAHSCGMALEQNSELLNPPTPHGSRPIGRKPLPRNPLRSS